MRWRARTIVQSHGARRASRPQLKRDPLGGTLEDCSQTIMTSPHDLRLHHLGGQVTGFDRPPRPVVPFTLLLLITMAIAHPRRGLAQELALTAEMGKRAFFEDEPIFLVLRLKNVGSDTAWVMDFGAISNSVEMSVRRRDGALVAVGGLWIDRWCRRADRCGDPLAPGRSQLSAGILQDRAGEERDFQRSLFLHHLGPGEYELGLRTLGVEAAPIAFRIRQRTATETRELTELEAIRWMVWDRTHPTNYEGALISWVGQHLQDDAFLPYLLAQWLYGGMIDAVARQANLDLDSLRVAVIKANRSSPAGAYIAQSMAGWRPQQLVALAEPLGASLVGEMARSLAERMQHKHQ